MTTQATELPPPPRPEPSIESQPYWDGLREHRLLVQRCSECGTLRHYPRPMCPSCYSLRFDWSELSGRGQILSWTVNHHPFHPGFKQQVPYVTVTVDMAEGVRMQAPLRNAAAEDVRAGQAVTLGFEDVDDTLTVPCFTLATPA